MKKIFLFVTRVSTFIVFRSEALVTKVWATSDFFFQKPDSNGSFKGLKTSQIVFCKVQQTQTITDPFHIQIELPPPHSQLFLYLRWA